MPISVIGLNSRLASIDVRELFSFNASGVESMLNRWRQTFPNVEVVFVSTCNRTELYFAQDRGTTPTIEQVFPFLIAPKYQSESYNITYERYAEKFYVFSEIDAASHLFSVASSLDSMILGEPQILSQIKKAYEISSGLNTTGPILNDAFQTAFKTAKRVSVETDIFKRRVSIPSVAVVDFALNIFERLTDKKTLVLGAGEMAEETLKYLADFGASSITVANRSMDKAIALAERWKGGVINWEDRFEALIDADLVICATGANEPIISLDDYCRIEKRRKKGASLFILDLAVPRNIDVKIGERPNVYLYSVDDLESACVRNKELRDREIPKAMRIVEDEAGKFIAKAISREAIDTIKKLRESWNLVKAAETKRLLNKIQVDEREERTILEAFDRLTNKLLHTPTVAMRTSTLTGTSHKLTEALRKLFKI